MTLRERRMSVTLLGWIGAAGTAVVVAASRLDPLVAAVATPLLAFFVLVAPLSLPTHRADMERRRAAMRAARRMRDLLQECSQLGDEDFEVVTNAVARALIDLLELEGCWFEAVPGASDLPEIGPDGDVSARVRFRVEGGAALPPLVALPVAGPAGGGRFVLEANPAVGLSPERRVLAVAMAQVVALRTVARGRAV